jgi:pimeloyl-ACP methyl ester carboxylesterase
MAEFVLIHGAWHGAWCWDEVIPNLRLLGHVASAIDLPGLGSDSTPLSEVTLDAYVQRIIDYVRSRNNQVWLVGHSMGGVAITQAGEMIADRLSGLIYVTALVPLDGQSALDLASTDNESNLNTVIHIDPDTNTASLASDSAHRYFYNCCSDTEVARAKRLLRGQQALNPSMTPVTVTGRNLGRVPRYYVECLQDHVITISAQRRMYQAAGISRVATLDTDHSPFLSCPKNLAEALHGFTLWNSTSR